MNINDLVSYYNSFEESNTYGLVLKELKNVFIVLWFDDYKTSEEPKGEWSTDLKIVSRFNEKI